VVSVARQPVAGTYLVTLAAGRQAGASAAATEHAAGSLTDRFGGRLDKVLTRTMRGFIVKDLSEQQARRLAAHPDVAEVRQSGTARIGDGAGPGGTQNNPQNWGLDRIDQRDRPLDSKYTYPNDGAGVTAYIVDTGIRYTHQEFEGRAKFGVDLHATPNQGNDCHNHGSHVAGIVAGNTRGVAKKTNLVSVRILGCDGFGEDVDLIEAAEWIAQNGVKPAVVNLSVYTDDPDIAVNAIRGSISAGFQWALITGNNGGNACNYGPGGQMTEALTVGNSTNQDTRAFDSNAGSCMDLWAPGSGINSAFRGSDSAYGNLSGTSMAAPHVAGTMALRLSEAPGSTPAQLHQWVLDNASTGKMSGIPADAPNKLVYVPNTPPATNDFSIAASPASVSVDPGSSVSTTVSTTVTNGSAQTVALSASGLPSGVTATCEPTSVTAGQSSRLTLAAAASAGPTRTTVTVTGRGTDVTRTANVGLTVNGDVPDDFALSTDPSSGTVAAGNSVTTTVRATAAGVAPPDTGQSSTAMREETGGAGPGSGAGVVGGTATTVSKYPFIISQHRTGGARPTEQSCTGSVVAPRKVLIAAHCKFSQGEPKYLIYGRDDLADTSKGVRIEIQGYLTHPNYNPSDGWRIGYDVAVITTTTDIPTPAGMAYPPVADSSDNLPLGTRGTAVGYGKSDPNDAQRNTKLYEAVLPTVSSQNCNAIAGHFDDRYMMCSGYGGSDGPHLCQGDSGGPYLHNGKIYGVFSWLRTDCGSYNAHGKLWGVMGDWANEQFGGGEPPTGEITLSASGLPSGASATFNPAKVDVGGNSQLTISTSASTPAGDYTITVSGTRDSVTRQATYRLTVSGGSTTLSLANPGTQTSVRGRPVRLQLNASGGRGGNRFSATGLPAGLSVNASTGLISGIPTTATNYRPTVKVTDSSGASASATFYWFIFPF
jgi:subtilisin family serine protease